MLIFCIQSVNTYVYLYNVMIIVYIIFLIRLLLSRGVFFKHIIIYIYIHIIIVMYKYIHKYSHLVMSVHKVLYTFFYTHDSHVYNIICKNIACVL